MPLSALVAWFRHELSPPGAMSKDARDYCASERNALSYVRLCLTLALLATTFIGEFRIGAVSNRPDSPGQASLKERDLAVPLGLTFATLSALILWSGTLVHLRTMRSLLQGEPSIGPSALDMATLGVAALIVLAAIILLVVAH